jgi:hypothetical protein
MMPFTAYGPLGLSMEFEGQASGAKANVLIDSGAGDCFLSARFARTLNLVTHPCTGSIRVGDNRESPIVGKCTLKFRIQAFAGSRSSRLSIS